MMRKPKIYLRYLLGMALLFTTVSVVATDKVPQDKGLPYTRSARATALKTIGNRIALFPGSRYAYVDGKKIRLDDQDMMECWSVMKDGKLYVPQAFAGAIASKRVKFRPIPADLQMLEDRWVYTASYRKVRIPTGVPTIQVKGKTYFAVADFARQIGKQVFTNERGLVLIDDENISYTANAVQDDCVVTLFDTPEKYADPDISIRYIPYLKQQGKWTDHARVTKKQLKEIEEGEETEWPLTPQSEYNLDGFNSTLLGSKVPAPGVYPRLLFSPRDIPMLKKHIAANKSAQKGFAEIEVLFKKTWLDENTSDGKIFKLLYNGELDEIRKRQLQPTEGAAVYHMPRLTEDHKPGIYNSHITYVTNCLTTMAFYAMLTDNNELGEKVADALVSYYKLIEPKVEEHLKNSDSEFGINFDGASHATTHWRGMHGVVPHMDLPFSLDFAGKWMDKKQIKFMQNLIAKATYGRRTGAGDGPKRAWRDINHMTWHLTHLLAITAIEGCEGFDPEAYLSGKELVRDFLEFGIDKSGQIFESNGKSGGGIQFQVLSMISEARRSNNLWGHPHWRKLTEGLVYATSPDGKETVSSGTWGGSPFSFQTTQELKAFFPGDKNADFLLSSIEPTYKWKEFDVEKYRSELEKKYNSVRLPGPTYPSLTWAFPYTADWEYVTHRDISLPLDWNSEVHGAFSTANKNSRDAAWLYLLVRDNHYIGSGHHHSDAGMFYFSSHEVNWITETAFPKVYSSRYHNQLLIDGYAQSEECPAKADYLGAKSGDKLSTAAVDLSYAYNWTWCTQVRDWGTAFAQYNAPVYTDKVWELETRPEILKIFRGTSRYKMRIWWATPNQANFIPTLRAPWNPVKYVYRSVGLVKGDDAFGIVCNDACKDDNNHLYQWTAMLGRNVWKANVKNVPANCTVLAHSSAFDGQKAKVDAPAIDPRKSDPLLMVCALGMKESDVVDLPLIQAELALDGPLNGQNKPNTYARLVINQVDKKVNYRVLLIPFRYGETLPAVKYDGRTATVTRNGKTDKVVFGQGNDNRTEIKVL